METGIHIGNKIDAKEAAGPLSEAVVRVLAAISEHRIDRETGIKALDVVALAGTPAYTTVSDCHIDGSTRQWPKYTRYEDGATGIDNDIGEGEE